MYRTLSAIALVAAQLVLATPSEADSPRGMALVPGGSFRAPLRVGAAVPVRPFYLDVLPVTNRQYLEFVRANPQWRRSRVRPLFADSGYLAHWRGDLDAGGSAALDRPVVNVSWFAARAYAQWRGRRLPSTVEWELAASAGLRGPSGDSEPGYARGIAAWLSRPRPPVLPRVGGTPANYWGVRDLHGLVFEWVSDFNSAILSADSRRSGDANSGSFCGAGAVGASDFRDYPAFLRYGFRAGLRARYAVPNLGFRTAMDATVTQS